MPLVYIAPGEWAPLAPSLATVLGVHTLAHLGTSRHWFLLWSTLNRINRVIIETNICRRRFEKSSPLVGFGSICYTIYKTTYTRSYATSRQKFNVKFTGSIVKFTANSIRGIVYYDRKQNEFIIYRFNTSIYL